jgi:glucosamine kinase
MEMRKRLFIGIDGGATHCRARIADDSGNVLGSATFKGSANISSARKPASVMRAILRALRSAARQARLAEADWKRAPAGLGLAGGDVTAARDELARLFGAEGYFSASDIRTDAYVTWLGAFHGEDGAILILGTGSCGLAVVKGREKNVSGYGPQVSDEASSQWLGRMALRRSLWALDGRIGRTPLADEILRRFHGKPEEIIIFAKEAAASDFGRLAPLVFEHADKRDPLAVALVNEAAADAERMIVRLLELGAPSVYLHGGLVKPLLPWLRAGVRKRLQLPADVEGIALDGAILLAQRAARTRAGRR